MGFYTGLAKLGTKRWESRRYVCHGANEGERTASVEETRWVCPDCREFFPFEDDCPRCERPVLDRTVSLPAARGETRVRILGLPGHGSPAVYVLAVVSLFLGLGWIPIVEYFEGAGSGGVVALLGAAAAVAIMVPVADAVVSRVLARSRQARAAKRAREAMLAMPRMATSELPAETPEPVRVRGRVCFDVTETAIRVRVCDETGDVVLPERAVVRARAAASSHEELSSVHDGDEVEIVCRGRRKPRAGETYRACASEFEIDADVPVEVWVERRRG